MAEYLIINQFKSSVNYIEDMNQIINNDSELDKCILAELLNYELDKIQLVSNEDESDVLIINIPVDKESFDVNYINKIIKNKKAILIINKDINSNIEKCIRYSAKDIPIFSLRNNKYCLNIFNKILEVNNKNIIKYMYEKKYDDINE